MSCKRRILICLSTVFINQTSFVTMVIYLVSSQVMMCIYLDTYRMKTLPANVIEILHESCVILTSYFLLFCTNWLYIDNLEVKYNIGYFYLIIILIVICLNIIYIFFNFRKSVKFQRRKSKFKKAWKEYNKIHFESKFKEHCDLVEKTCIELKE